MNSSLSLAQMTHIALEYDTRWHVSRQITGAVGNGHNGHGMNQGASGFEFGIGSESTPMELGNIRFKGKCYHCGKTGHKEEDCWKKFPNKALRPSRFVNPRKQKGRKKGKQPRGSSQYVGKQNGRVNNLEARDGYGSDSGSTDQFHQEN